MNAETKAKAPAHAIWALILAPIGVFLTSLDVVVVSTALPVLRTELNASLSDLEWTINAYNLAFACLMMTGAALGDRFGRKRMFIVGLTIFSLASAACAIASSADALIVARIIQGAGAAIVMPLTLTLIINAFPTGKRGAAIGIWGAVSGLGVAAGPVVGGAITEGVSWQWIFWVNVPIGLAVAAVSSIKLRESRGPRPQLDMIGLVLVAIGAFGLVWAPVRAPLIGWDSAEVITALVVGAAFLVGFVAWERRAPNPMLPMHYFRRRGFATANGVAFAQQVSLIGSLFIMSQLFQIGLGYSPLQAGIRLLAWNATLMVVSPITGVLSEKLGDRPFIVLGIVLQVIGLSWLALVVEPGVGYTTLVGPLLVAGVGISMVFPTVANQVTTSVPLEDAGVAAGVNSAMRELGAVFGVAMIALVFANNGSYSSPESFIDGFTAAMWAAVAFAAVAIIPALLSPGKQEPHDTTSTPTPLTPEMQAK